MATHTMQQMMAVCECHGASSQAFETLLLEMCVTYLAHFSNFLHSGMALLDQQWTGAARPSCLQEALSSADTKYGSSASSLAQDGTLQQQTALNNLNWRIRCSCRKRDRLDSSRAVDTHAELLSSASLRQVAGEDGRSTSNANSHSGMHEQQVSI